MESDYKQRQNAVTKDVTAFVVKIGYAREFYGAVFKHQPQVGHGGVLVERVEKLAVL